MPTGLRLLLVTLSVGGGYTGLVVTVQAMAGPGEQPSATVAILAGFVVLYLFVLVSGLLLVYNPRWLMPSVFALAAQVPIFSSPVIAYRLTSGMDASAAITGGELVLSYHFGSIAQFNYNQQLPFVLGINFIALPLFIFMAVTAIRARRATVTASAPQSAAA